MGEESVLVGEAEEIVSQPEEDWRRELMTAPAGIAQRLDFMTGDHHRVRNFVVRRIAETPRPVAPDQIASSLELPVEEVQAMLVELERGLFFLVRNERGDVSWAFPVTAEPTPHTVDFGGERPAWGA